MGSQNIDLRLSDMDQPKSIILACEDAHKENNTMVHENLDQHPNLVDIHKRKLYIYNEKQVPDPKSDLMENKNIDVQTVNLKSLPYSLLETIHKQNEDLPLPIFRRKKESLVQTLVKNLVDNSAELKATSVSDTMNYSHLDSISKEDENLKFIKTENCSIKTVVNNLVFDSNAERNSDLRNTTFHNEEPVNSPPLRTFQESEEMPNLKESNNTLIIDNAVNNFINNSTAQLKPQPYDANYLSGIPPKFLHPATLYKETEDSILPKITESKESLTETVVNNIITDPLPQLKPHSHDATYINTLPVNDSPVEIIPKDVEVLSIPKFGDNKIYLTGSLVNNSITDSVNLLEQHLHDTTYISSLPKNPAPGTLHQETEDLLLPIIRNKKESSTETLVNNLIGNSGAELKSYDSTNYSGLLSNYSPLESNHKDAESLPSSEFSKTKNSFTEMVGNNITTDSIAELMPDLQNTTLLTEEPGMYPSLATFHNKSEDLSLLSLKETNNSQTGYAMNNLINSSVTQLKLPFNSTSYPIGIPPNYLHPETLKKKTEDSTLPKFRETKEFLTDTVVNNLKTDSIPHAKSYSHDTTHFSELPVNDSLFETIPKGEEIMRMQKFRETKDAPTDSVVNNLMTDSAFLLKPHFYSTKYLSSLPKYLSSLPKYPPKETFNEETEDSLLATFRDKKESLTETLVNNLMNNSVANLKSYDSTYYSGLHSNYSPPETVPKTAEILSILEFRNTENSTETIANNLLTNTIALLKPDLCNKTFLSGVSRIYPALATVHKESDDFSLSKFRGENTSLKDNAVNNIMKNFTTQLKPQSYDTTYLKNIDQKDPHPAVIYKETEDSALPNFRKSKESLTETVANNVVSDSISQFKPQLHDATHFYQLPVNNYPFITNPNEAEYLPSPKFRESKISPTDTAENGLLLNTAPQIKPHSYDPNYFNNLPMKYLPPETPHQETDDSLFPTFRGKKESLTETAVNTFVSESKPYSHDATDVSGLPENDSLLKAINKDNESSPLPKLPVNHSSLVTNPNEATYLPLPKFTETKTFPTHTVNVLFNTATQVKPHSYNPNHLNGLPMKYIPPQSPHQETDDSILPIFRNEKKLLTETAVSSSVSEAKPCSHDATDVSGLPVDYYLLKTINEDVKNSTLVKLPVNHSPLVTNPKEDEYLPLPKFGESKIFPTDTAENSLLLTAPQMKPHSYDPNYLNGLAMEYLPPETPQETDDSLFPTFRGKKESLTETAVSTSVSESKPYSHDATDVSGLPVNNSLLKSINVNVENLPLPKLPDNHLSFVTNLNEAAYLPLPKFTETKMSPTHTVENVLFNTATQVKPHSYNPNHLNGLPMKYIPPQSPHQETDDSLLPIFRNEKKLLTETAVSSSVSEAKPCSHDATDVSGLPVDYYLLKTVNEDVKNSTLVKLPVNHSPLVTNPNEGEYLPLPKFGESKIFPTDTAENSLLLTAPQMKPHSYDPNYLNGLAMEYLPPETPQETDDSLFPTFRGKKESLTETAVSSSVSESKPYSHDATDVSGLPVNNSLLKSINVNVENLPLPKLPDNHLSFVTNPNEAAYLPLPEFKETKMSPTHTVENVLFNTATQVKPHSYDPNYLNGLPMKYLPPETPHQETNDSLFPIFRGKKESLTETLVSNSVTELKPYPHDVTYLNGLPENYSLPETISKVVENSPLPKLLVNNSTFVTNPNEADYLLLPKFRETQTPSTDTLQNGLSFNIATQMKQHSYNPNYLNGLPMKYLPPETPHEETGDSLFPIFRDNKESLTETLVSNCVTELKPYSHKVTDFSSLPVNYSFLKTINKDVENSHLTKLPVNHFSHVTNPNEAEYLPLPKFKETKTSSTDTVENGLSFNTATQVKPHSYNSNYLNGLPIKNPPPEAPHEKTDDSLFPTLQGKKESLTSNSVTELKPYPHDVTTYFNGLPVKYSLPETINKVVDNSPWPKLSVNYSPVVTIPNDAEYLSLPKFRETKMSPAYTVENGLLFNTATQMKPYSYNPNYLNGLPMKYPPPETPLKAINEDVINSPLCKFGETKSYPTKTIVNNLLTNSVTQEKLQLHNATIPNGSAIIYPSMATIQKDYEDLSLPKVKEMNSSLTYTVVNDLINNTSTKFEPQSYGIPYLHGIPMKYSAPATLHKEVEDYSLPKFRQAKESLTETVVNNVMNEAAPQLAPHSYNRFYNVSNYKEFEKFSLPKANEINTPFKESAANQVLTNTNTQLYPYVNKETYLNILPVKYSPAATIQEENDKLLLHKPVYMDDSITNSVISNSVSNSLAQTIPHVYSQAYFNSVPMRSQADRDSLSINEVQSSNGRGIRQFIHLPANENVVLVYDKPQNIPESIRSSEFIPVFVNQRSSAARVPENAVYYSGPNNADGHVDSSIMKPEHEAIPSNLVPRAVNTYIPQRIHNMQQEHAHSGITPMQHNSLQNSMKKVTALPVYTTTEVNEVERAEKLNRAFEHMIKLVHIMGQVDTYVSDKARSVLKTLASVCD